MFNLKNFKIVLQYNIDPDLFEIYKLEFLIFISSFFLLYYLLKILLYLIFFVIKLDKFDYYYFKNFSKGFLFFIYGTYFFNQMFDKLTTEFYIQLFFDIVDTFLFTPFLIEFFLFFSSILYVLFFCFCSNLKINTPKKLNQLYAPFKKLLLFFCLSSFYVLWKDQSLIEEGLFFNSFLFNDFSTINFRFIILFTYTFSYCSYISFNYKNFQIIKLKNEFPILFFGMCLFTLIAISAYDIYIMGFCIIGLSVCIYALMIMNYEFGKLAREAAFKYFIMSAFSSILILGGAKEIFLITGSLNYKIINDFIIYIICENTGIFEIVSLKIGLIIIFAGFCFKLSAAPSHFWAPEIYNGSPYALISIFILPVKITVSLIFLKLIKSIFSIIALKTYINYLILNEFEILLIIVILLSMVIGGINAIFEKKIKRFIAYSSINQIGFLLIGLLGFNSSVFAIQSFIYFLIIYVLNMCIFFCLIFWYSNLLLFNFSVIKNDNNINFKIFRFYYISDLNNLIKIQILRVNKRWFYLYFLKITGLWKYTAFSLFSKKLEKEVLDPFTVKKKNYGLILFILVIFSLAGIPPLAGFFGKFYLLLYAFKMKYWIVLFIGIIVSIISSLYYLNIIKTIFFDSAFTTNWYAFPTYEFHYSINSNFPQYWREALKNLNVTSFFWISIFFFSFFYCFEYIIFNQVILLSQNILFLF